MGLVSEITAVLRGDNSHLNQTFRESANQAGKFGGQIAGELGSNFSKIGKIGNALETALGLNMTNIADHVARLWTGITKEEEAAYKELDNLSDQHLALVTKNRRAEMTEEQRYQMLLLDRERALKAIAAADLNTAQGQVKSKKAEIELENALSQIREHERKKAEEFAKKQDEFVKNRISQAEKEVQAQLDIADGAERIAALKENIAATQKIIESGVLSEADAQRFVNTLAERKIQLTKEEADLAKKSSDDRKKYQEQFAKDEEERKDALERYHKARSLGDKEEIEFLALKKKSLTGLTDSENARYKVLQQQKKERELEAELQDLIAKRNRGELTKSDEERLLVINKQLKAIDEQKAAQTAVKGTLDEQLATLQKQGMSREQMIAVLRQQDFSESEILKKLEAQTAEIQRQITIKRTGQDYEDQTTTALEGVRSRVKSQLDQVRQQNAMVPVNQRNPAQYALESELAQIDRELAARRNIANFVSKTSEADARFKYGDSLTDRALRSLQDEQTKTRVTMEQFLEAFKKSVAATPR